VLPADEVRELHALAGLESDGRIGNAGLIHVYGYLRSSVVTPYGPKHARWTEGAVARALGLAPARLLPDPARDARGETPLAVLTPILERLLADPPSAAAVVDEAAERLAARTVAIGGLLVYGVGIGGPILPITVFPVADDAIAAIEAEPPRLRYNAVDGDGRARTPLDSRRVRRAAGGATA